MLSYSLQPISCDSPFKYESVYMYDRLAFGLPCVLIGNYCRSTDTHLQICPLRLIVSPSLQLPSAYTHTGPDNDNLWFFFCCWEQFVFPPTLKICWLESHYLEKLTFRPLSIGGCWLSLSISRLPVIHSYWPSVYSIWGGGGGLVVSNPSMLWAFFWCFEPVRFQQEARAQICKRLMSRNRFCHPV
jgi:hypothetical protein